MLRESNEVKGLARPYGLKGVLLKQDKTLQQRINEDHMAGI